MNCAAASGSCVLAVSVSRTSGHEVYFLPTVIDLCYKALFKISGARFMRITIITSEVLACET
jgi:hypothetical protein